ncbi:hypothetical protein M0802_003462 [Mischocyttarus mexicanus]|nr:hypothetical protein M0802_003462 [Mischocyttarus mexicanus]
MGRLNENELEMGYDSACLWDGSDVAVTSGNSYWKFQWVREVVGEREIVGGNKSGLIKREVTTIAAIETLDGYNVIEPIDHADV